MSELLNTVTDLKIPYPTEGVIRTAQLDDTIAPEESVQLAVNMNFDRIGAVQTRLGVAEYADDLADPVENYGTLRNSIIPPGGARLAQLGAITDVADPDFSAPSVVEVSETKVAIFWSGTDNDGFCQNFEVDHTTGTITPLGTVLEFDVGNATEVAAMKISGSRVIAVWRGVSSDGFVQCFDCSADSIVAYGSPLEFDTVNAENFALAQVDSTHCILFYTSTTDDGIATIFAVDGSFTVTEPGAALTFEAGTNFGNTCASLGDGTHFINFWNTGANTYAQVFTVNTGTWAITAEGSALGWETLASKMSTVAVGDGDHFVTTFQNTAGGDLEAQVFEVNLSTFAVTEVGTSVVYNTISTNGQELVGLGDGEHFASFYCRNVGDGYIQLLEMDPLTFDMSVIRDPLSGYDFSNQGIAPILIESYEILAVWGLTLETGGKAAFFKGLGDVVSGSWLYAGHADEVSNWDGANWTSRRSGLAQVSKPRFSQYLNYIWMVNGNINIGGDPVATSNGGAFGTTLVPTDFPPGDFIHAGFEGRVWVADKTLGILYYTDIVQFTPPDVYQLTFNPEVNFITQIAPQTGQSFTAMHRVPRALLVFTEDNIYRIYGATSLDAYPAYNVGTYSQESIIETKTGIFFHHSSGFYQFDYGSQPVEISRRVIDFVRAIPRAYYDDITGVYDGFDAVEWSVGQVTVEGVVFANCVMRYTISTQVWTIYDYVGNTINAMIYYDDGTNKNHLVGTEAGKTGALDSGYTDFGTSFYYEIIDRWRSYTPMYCQIKSIGGISVYSENAAGANLTYQIQKSGPNAWRPIGTITDKNNAIIPNVVTDDFDVARLRIAGTTSGTQVVIHGIEITQLTVKGYDQN